MKIYIMIRQFFLVVLIFTVHHIVCAQDYQQRAKNNLPLLVRDEVLLEQITVDDKGVTLFATAQDKVDGKPETTVLWSEVPTFLALLNKGTFQKNVERYLAKGTAPYKKTKKPPPSKQLPKTLKGLRIALDPGHNANRFETAVIERKYMKIKGSDLGLTEDVQFFESDLVYETAAILKKRLEAEGAKVFMSRGRGESSHGPDFDTWLERKKNKEFRKDKRKGKLTAQEYNWYKDTATTAQLFRYYFNRKDLQTRADKINAWRPDLTLNIHYNASGANPVDGYFKPTDKNYGMMFVGGGYMKGELKKPEARLHFLRLLLSEDLETSMQLSEIMMDEHEQQLAVPSIPNDNNIRYLNKNSVYTGKRGVYARNLFLTRTIMGTLCFGESFLQDNAEEAKRLVLEDYEESGIVTSKRIEEAVTAFYNGLLEYLAEYGNK